MNKVKFLMFAMVAAFAVACVQDPEMGGSKSTETAVAAKVVNTSTDAIQGELIIYVDDATAHAWSEAENITRSGNVMLESIASELNATSVEQVFNMAMNKEEKMALGLHRWFVVNFDEEYDLNKAAKLFAEMPEVSRIQFGKKLVRPNVEGARPIDMPMTRASEDMPYNDPMLPLQWHYNNTGSKTISQFARVGEDIGAFGAWEYTKGNRQVIVAVVDEGVKYDHMDLKDNMWVNEAELNGTSGVDDDKNGWIDDIYGVNTYDQNGDISWDLPHWDSDGYYDGDSGHGTHVAGTIAAVNNNNLGVSGIAGGSGNNDGVRIMSIQIFDGGFSSGDMKSARGVEYAADMGASILQNSWGYTVNSYTDDLYKKSSPLLVDAINYFVGRNNCPAMRGGVAIFAAGNDGWATANYPGAYNEYIAVTSVGPDGLPTTYTNYKYGCNVAAPGGEYEYSNRKQVETSCVLSTIPAESPDPYTNGQSTYGKDYGYMQGTSMACPHVSGVAALVLSYALENGITISNTQLYDILTTSVRQIDNSLKGKTKTAYTYKGEAYTMNLDPYTKGMGTGKLDATLAILSLRGATCLPVVVGEEVEMDLNAIIGTGDLNVKLWKDQVIDPVVKERLGIKGETVFANKFIFTCTKPGIGTLKVKFIAGGDTVGGGNTTGGKLVETEVVVIARENNDDGGWL